MKKFARTATTAIAMTAALSATAPSFAGEKTLLKTPVAFGTHLPALGTPIKWVSEQLPVMSGNKLKMKIYEPGKLVAPPEILDAVSSGKINSVTSGSYIIIKTFTQIKCTSNHVKA